ncbi:unnamed protein product [Prorocentrum cordatum]|uniref:Uncharacterized protein n=1 Tax=Prorocentrum cordatum TaxID=2364126 RepID=A0ABN9RN73_9DINO|nr:unnamed protein product [Polarella glacialis]
MMRNWSWGKRRPWRPGAGTLRTEGPGRRRLHGRRRDGLDWRREFGGGRPRVGSSSGQSSSGEVGGLLCGVRCALLAEPPALPIVRSASDLPGARQQSGVGLPFGATALNGSARGLPERQVGSMPSERVVPTQRRPQCGRSRSNAAGGPESTVIERSAPSESRDRSGWNSPRGIRSQRASLHETNPP